VRAAFRVVSVCCVVAEAMLHLGPPMTILLVALLIADGIIFLASQARGQAWAELVCAPASALCANPTVIGVLAVIVGGILLVQRIAR
jgi:hypothetical protein